MRWSDEEKEILRANYFVLSKEELALLLPNRTRTQIISQVHQLRKRGWAFEGRYKK
jgi:biotin operon repressor